MKTKSILIVLGVLLLLAVNSFPAWPQVQLAKVEGKITDNGKPVPEVQVVMTNNDTGRVFKMKTDKNGYYFGVGFPVAEYKVQILSASGETLFTINKTAVTIEGGANVVLNIDLTKDRSKGTSGQPTMSKDQIEALKSQNAKAVSLNALITQYTNAANSKNWPDAIALLQSMLQIDPNKWEYLQALGGAYLNNSQYQESVDAFEKGVAAAKDATADPKADQAKIKLATAQMLANQGNGYLKLHNNPAAITAFTKAAELDPNPGVAYFNLCATQYNTGNVDGAMVACDKAIQADPNKADAYFIKGSLMMAGSVQDKDGKIKAPPGTAETLAKYLELEPAGGHAADVKAMLEFIGSKLETTYGKTKKK